MLISDDKLMQQEVVVSELTVQRHTCKYHWSKSHLYSLLRVKCIYVCIVWYCRVCSLQQRWTKSRHMYTCTVNGRCCRIVLAVLFAFLIIFVIVDVTVTTKNYYNLISLAGICFYVLIMFIFSTAPRKASSFVWLHIYKVKTCLTNGQHLTLPVNHEISSTWMIYR